MKRVNPTAIFLVVLVLVLAGLFLPGPASGIVLLLLAAAATALVVATWDRLPPIGRVVRLTVLGLLALVALGRIF